MNVTVVGLGYVGAVTAACLAELGHVVLGVDIDELKVGEIEGGRSPIVEPKLAELVASGRAAGRLRATTDLGRGLQGSDLVLVCVGTPARSDGTVDLENVVRVTEELAARLKGMSAKPTVVYRSTMPPGTVDAVLQPLLARVLEDSSLDVAMVPEFLREGTGVDDFFDPPYTVVGTASDRAADALEELLETLARPMVVVPIAAAEALKYACNAFHAVKITFANEIGRVLHAVGLDSREVMSVLVQDDRLNTSSAYLRPAFAFGGSCLPKDLRALVHVARVENVDTPMLASVLRSNDMHRELAVRRIMDDGYRSIALLGLSFKPETDDLRESPYVDLAETLIGKGCDVRIYDPIVNPSRLIGTNRRYIESALPHLGRILVSDPIEALKGAQTAVVCTDHPDIATALVTHTPRFILDLHGGLGRDVESLPGYEGMVW